jgi:hypothetical protein
VQRYLTSLRCTQCAAERPHAVTYLGNVFASATCTVCGETFRPRADVLIADYVRDFEHRIARKPGRMLDHARRHPLFFVFHYLPRGLVSKPREVLKEWEVLARTNQADHGSDRGPDRGSVETGSRA